MACSPCHSTEKIKILLVFEEAGNPQNIPSEIHGNYWNLGQITFIISAPIISGRRKYSIGIIDRNKK